MDLTRYYTRICKEPTVGKEEELELFQEYYSDEVTEGRKQQIKDRIIGANLRFAFKQAKTYSKNDPTVFAELISAANEGLLVGFEKYSPSKNVRYLSYAGWWVIQRILDEMSNMRIVSLPKWKQQLSAKIVKVLDNNETMKLSELKEMFVKLGIAERDIDELYATRYLTYYIDDLDENEFEHDPITEMLNNDLDRRKLLSCVHSLPSPHREIIARSFGLEDGKEYSPTKLARTLKKTKEEIATIRREGLEALRLKLTGIQPSSLHIPVKSQSSESAGGDPSQPSQSQIDSCM